jgi:hypothetical protein
MALAFVLTLTLLGFATLPFDVESTFAVQGNQTANTSVKRRRKRMTRHVVFHRQITEVVMYPTRDAKPQGPQALISETHGEVVHCRVRVRADEDRMRNLPMLLIRATKGKKK